MLVKGATVVQVLMAQGTVKFKSQLVDFVMQNIFLKIKILWNLFYP